LSASALTTRLRQENLKFKKIATKRMASYIAVLTFQLVLDRKVKINVSGNVFGIELRQAMRNNANTNFVGAAITWSVV